MPLDIFPVPAENHVSRHAESGADPYVSANPTPKQQNLLAWSCDPSYASGGPSAPTAGVLQMIRVIPYADATVTNILIYAGVGGTTPTNCYAGIYAANGGLLKGSADQATPWASGGLKTVALTSTQAVTRGTSYWVGFLIGGGTPPSFQRSSAAVTALLNAGCSAGAGRAMTYSTGLTALPDPVTMASAASLANLYWVAFS